MRRLLLPIEQRKGHFDGFVLPIVMVLGFIIFAGAMATSTRSFSVLYGSIRQSQSRQAREAAESGLARIIEKLNSDYSYLLVEPALSNWESPNYPTSICPGSTRSNSIDLASDPLVTGKLFDDTARYTLTKFTFNGTKFYGGTATFLVKGEKLSSTGDIQATAFVEKTVDIKPKNCGAPLNGNPTNSGFPGLLGKTIDMGNNDVWGSVSGNVLCTTCTGTSEDEIEDEIKLFKKGDIEGNLFAGPIAMPTPDSPPAGTTPFAITGETSITAGSQPAGSPCTFDGTTTHCNITSITLNSQNLSIDSSNGPVNLYVSGDITMGGQASIVHTKGGQPGHPWDLAILGNPENTETSACSQEFTLNGGSTTANVFVHAPDACVGINGGSQKPDIRGAVWSKHFDGSRSNNAEIEVPDDMGDIGANRDPAYGISITDFVAIGARDWKSFQLED